MLLSGTQEHRTQKYKIIVAREDQFKAIINTPKENFALDIKLGSGSFGAVHTIKKMEISPDFLDATIYTTQENIDPGYALKQIYDITPFRLRLDTQTQADLRAQSDIPSYSSHLLPFADEPLAAIAKETEYQMAVEEELQRIIQTTVRIDQFILDKQKERETMLQEAKAEADYITRYYAATGDKAIVLEGQPSAAVAFRCKHAYASIKYQPAIAILMPKAPGICLWDYPKKHFHTEFCFSLLLKMLIKIVDAFSHLHQLNILHLDANPNNIMLDPEKEKVQLIDFGMAKNIVDEHGNATTIPRIPQDNSYRYWRTARMRPKESDPSNVTVGIEDDAFSLIACLSYLINEYQLYVKKITLAAFFVDYLGQIQALLNQPGACMSHALSSIRQIISLTSRLMELQATSIVTKEQLDNAIFELKEASPHLIPESTLAVEAQAIIDKAQSLKALSISPSFFHKTMELNSKDFSTIVAGFSQEKENKNTNLCSNDTACLFSMGTSQPAPSKHKKSRNKVTLSKAMK